MKRLVELDANNPNIVKESADLAECGMMPEMGGMGSPSTPASINMTAGSGEELGNMLKDIMSLAGVSRVEPEQLGTEHEPSMMLPTPAIAVGPAVSAKDDMRSVLDKLNPEMGDDEEGEEETDEGQYDTSPNDPTDVPPIPPNGIGPQHDENQPGQGDRMDGTAPRAHPKKESQSAPTFESLMQEYREFVGESIEDRIGTNPTPETNPEKQNSFNTPAYIRRKSDPKSNESEGNSIDVQAVSNIISRFDQNMHEIGGYGDPDYKAAIAALEQGDVETAIGAVVDTYGNQNGGEVRGIDAYIEDLQDEFEYLVQGPRSESTEMESILKLAGLTK